MAVPLPRRPPKSTISSKQSIFTDDSSDSDWSSGYTRGNEDIKDRSKKYETRLLARLVSKRVLIRLGYPWVQQGNTIIVLGDLDEDRVEEILKLSEDDNRSHNELEDTSRNQTGTRRNSISEIAQPPTPPGVMTMGRQDRPFEKLRVMNNANHSLAETAAGGNDESAPRISHYQQHDPILRRKPSDLHLRSSAIARLGIPEAEARLVLENSRAHGVLQRSASDVNLAESRSYYPVQFDNMPYDHQRNFDDQVIKDLLVEWTPQWAGVPRGNDPADIGPKEGIMGGEGLFDVETEDDTSESSVVDGGFYDSFEHSSFENHILKTHLDGNILGLELRRDGPTPTEQDSRAKLPHEEFAKDVANLALGNDSTAEIERLEEQLSMLRSRRNAKRTDTGLPSRGLDEKTQHRTGKMIVPGAAQTPTQANAATAEHDTNTSSPSVPKKPAAQRRVTMDEAQDEADTNNSSEENPLTKVRDGEEGGTKHARASTFPRPTDSSQAEPEWAQRVLEDSTEFSEPTDPARADLVLSGSQSRRDVRAAQREASTSKRKGSERGKLRKAAPDVKSA